MAHFLFHSKFSHFLLLSLLSPHTLTITNSGLPFSYRSFSLSPSVSRLSFLLVSFLLYNTVIWLYFFPLTDRSIAPTCKGEKICSSYYFIHLYQNLNSLLWISNLIFFFSLRNFQFDGFQAEVTTFLNIKVPKKKKKKKKNEWMN